MAAVIVPRQYQIIRVRHLELIGLKNQTEISRINQSVLASELQIRHSGHTMPNR